MSKDTRIRQFNPADIAGYNDAKRLFASEVVIGKIIKAALPLQLPSGRVLVESFDDSGQPIKKEMTRRQALSFRLGLAARYYLIIAKFQNAPSHTELILHMKRIKQSAKRLHGLLTGGGPEGRPPHAIEQRLSAQARQTGGVRGGYADLFPDLKTIRWPFPGQPDALIDYQEEAIVRRLVAAMALVHSLAVGALTKEQELSKQKAGNARHQGDIAFLDFIANLGEIYSDIFGAEPGRSVGKPESRNAGKVGGPFIRFSEAVCKTLKLPKGNEAIEAAWRKASKKSIPK